MQVGVVGINHKLASLKVREKIAKVCHFRFGRCIHLHENTAFLLLSTCNRTEIYFSSKDLAQSHSYILNILRQEVDEDIDQKLYAFFSIDCFQHLCRVALGLDSAIIAETEIQGQVKEAYEYARKQIELPSAMHFLFQKSLRVSKQIRTNVLGSRGTPELQDAIQQVADHFFGSFHLASILFVGASTTNLKILSHLKKRGLEKATVCNRTLSKSVLIAEREHIDVLRWEQLSQWTAFDCVILGTKSPETIIHLPKNHVIRTSKLVIDLSVPRNAHPSLAKNPKITLVNIDQLQRYLKMRKNKLHNLMLKAEDSVCEASKRHYDLYHQKQQFNVSKQSTKILDLCHRN
ncbi:MAG: glutamyl-tRNA reductase [Chlamydiales bacterium]